MNYSTEACPSCQQDTGNTSTPNAKNQPVTYNDGEGQKDQLVMTGPLSEVFSRALDVVFEKKDLVSKDSPKVDMPEEPKEPNPDTNTAAESFSQDLEVEAMVNDMGRSESLDLVLGDFNIASVKDHVAQAKKGLLETDLNTPPPTTIYVTNPNDVTTAKTAEDLINQTGGEHDVIVMVHDTGNKGPVQPIEQTTSGEITEEIDYQAVTERIYEGTKVKVFWGTEALCHHLLKKKHGANFSNEGLRDTGSKILNKIQLMVEKFLGKGSSEQNQLKSSGFWGGSKQTVARAKEVELSLWGEWECLVRDGELTADGVVDSANQLRKLCIATGNFVLENFRVNQKSDTLEMTSPSDVASAVEHYFRSYRRSDKNYFELYYGIDDQTLSLTLINHGQENKPSVKAELVDLGQKMPSMFTMTKLDLDKIYTSVMETLNISLHVLDQFTAIMKKLQAGAQNNILNEVPNEVVAGYYSLIYTLLNGTINKSIKMATALRSLGPVVVKELNSAD